jgi:hypothetical protein
MRKFMCAFIATVVFLLGSCASPERAEYEYQDVYYKIVITGSATPVSLAYTMSGRSTSKTVQLPFTYMFDPVKALYMDGEFKTEYSLPEYIFEASSTTASQDMITMSLVRNDIEIYKEESSFYNSLNYALMIGLDIGPWVGPYVSEK